MSDGYAKYSSIFESAKGNTTYAPGENNCIISGNTILLVAPAYKGPDGNGVFYLTSGAQVTEVGDFAFSGNVHLTKVILPEVKSVGRFAFSECEKLKEVVFAPLTYIGDYAFERTALTKLVDLASGITEIGSFAFSETKLTEVTIGNNIVIGKGAFKNCHDLTKISIGDNVVVGV